MGSAGSHVTGDEKLWLVQRLIEPVSTLEDLEMLRRITLLIPLLIMLSMSGCIIFPTAVAGGMTIATTTADRGITIADHAA